MYRCESKVFFPVCRRRGVSGFTLLELLVASLIAAMLMIGVLELIAHLGLDRSRLLRQESDSETEHLVNLLRKDLLRAVNLRTDTPQEIEIEGYGAIDPLTLAATGRAARILYRIAPTQAGFWLVREQQPLDEPGSAPLTEFVATDVKSIAMTTRVPLTNRIKVAGVAGFLTDQGAIAGNATASDHAQQITPKMPSCVRVVIEWTDARRKPLQQDLVLR